MPKCFSLEQDKAYNVRFREILWQLSGTRDEQKEAPLLDELEDMDYHRGMKQLQGTGQP